MVNPLAPGKGLYADLVDETCHFFEEAFKTARAAYNQAGGDKAVDDEGADKVWIRMKNILVNDEDWKYYEDNFGKKVYARLPWGTGDLRVTVVFARGVLKIDVRSWYKP